jgi:hypothetical protein
LSDVRSGHKNSLPVFCNRLCERGLCQRFYRLESGKP